MKKIAILTCEKMPDLLDYDKRVAEELIKRNIDAKPVVWETNFKELKNFDFAIFRTTWGYHLKIEQFMEFLDFLDEIQIPTLNPVQIIRHNLHKFYLRDLFKIGINILPTDFISKDSDIHLIDIIKSNNFKKFIIKPAISAGSSNTFAFTNEEFAEADSCFKTFHKTHDLLIQEFMPEIFDGEISTIFFNRDYHYTVKKVPKTGDFRVQTLFGGTYTQITPPDFVLEASKKAMELYVDECLYIRVDGVISNNEFYIMEIELIEPDLYLDYVPEGIPMLANEINIRTRNI